MDSHSCHDIHFHGNIKRYWVIALITAITLISEVVGGYISGSLALFSDALHVGIDLASIIIALAVEYMAKNKAINSKNKIRGWGGVLGSTLLFISLVPISFAAIGRFCAPSNLQSTTMTWFAIVGLLGNAVCLWMLSQSEENHATHASLKAHIISDLAQSIGVVVAGFVIVGTGLYIIDPIASILIVLLLLRITFKTLQQSIKSIRD